MAQPSAYSDAERIADLSRREADLRQQLEGEEQALLALYEDL